MKHDAIKQFVNLRDSLLRERATLEKRLASINEALADHQMVKSRSIAPASAGKGTRVRNAISLREAVRKVTASKPLSKQEILHAIEKIGYKFSAKNPVNSLNTVLYSKKQFANSGGKFSPA